MFEVVRKDENVTNLTSGRDGLKEAINYRHNPNLNDRFFRLVCSMSEYDKYKQFNDLMAKGYNAELKSDYERMEKYFNFALKINPNDLTAKKKLEKALRKQAEESIENKAKEEAIRMEMERKCQEDAERIAKEEAERKTTEEAERKATEEAERKAKEEAENRLAVYRRLREANDDEFKTFCKDLLAKRAKAKSVGMLWKKSEEFEILTTPLTYNIFNSFRTGVVCTKSENETLMDQFKDKKDIALLIEKMGNAYKDEGVTFTIPSSREIVGAQSAKVVGKEGVYLVCHFPEFEE